MKIFRLRILLPIFLMHLVALPFLLYQYMIHFEEPVWEALGQSVMSELQDRIAVHQLTDTPGLPRVQAAVDEFSRRYKFLHLGVYDIQGNLRAAHGDPGSLKGSTNSAELHVVDGEYLLEVTRRVKNSGECHRCHAADQPHIGVIQASIAITDVAAKLGEQRKESVLVAFGTLLLVFGLISLFHYFFIVRPVSSISTALNKIQSGDLSVRVKVQHGGELGVIAKNINEMAASLSQARSQLEDEHRLRMTRAEQLATVGEIAAGLAHEVKNPLAGISSALEVVISESDERSPHREVLQQIIEETRRIAGTINRLLDYARPRRLQPEWLDLSLIAEDINGIFSAQCQKRKVTFELKTNTQVQRIFVDPTELKQVLLNLLLNALDAVAPGGKILMDIRQQNSHVVFAVTDNGKGMDAAVRDRIFQPFFTTKANGTGLGLAIVMRSVKGMGGNVMVKSEPGKGTTFTVSLPGEYHIESPDR